MKSQVYRTLLAALTGSAITGFVLLVNGFNPTNNPSWLAGAAGLAGISTLIVDLSQYGDL